MSRYTADLLARVEDLNAFSTGVDSDTVLYDVLEEADFEQSGLSHDLFNLWKSKGDAGRTAIEQMFYLLTEVKFDAYLKRCCTSIAETLDYAA